MSKIASSTTITTVRDSKSGRFVTVRGAGALKGKMMISKKVDLTKPISMGSSREGWAPKGGSFSGKIGSKSGHRDHSVGKP